MVLTMRRYQDEDDYWRIRKFLRQLLGRARSPPRLAPTISRVTQVPRQIDLPPLPDLHEFDEQHLGSIG